MPLDLPEDSYEMRLARQAVRVSRLWYAYQREMERMESIIKGTPPTITDNDVERIRKVPFSESDACWCQPFDGPVHLRCPMHGESLNISEDMLQRGYQGDPMQPALCQPPRIVEISEAEMRRMYPERFK